MPLSVPQIEKIRKDDPVLAEILRQIVDYVNQNVEQKPGNKVEKPPAT